MVRLPVLCLDVIQAPGLVAFVYYAVITNTWLTFIPVVDKGEFVVYRNAKYYTKFVGPNCLDDIRDLAYVASGLM